MVEIIDADRLQINQFADQSIIHIQAFIRQGKPIIFIDHETRFYILLNHLFPSRYKGRLISRKSIRSSIRSESKE